ncbi:hypothetical protein IJG20_02510 [Candidatus Saccharibacteria bacterium]|nr:hypothetical protein [Candidatus Saccharibacteria bacterium]
MEYGVGTFFIGFLIFVGGALIFIFYRQISEFIAHGVSSYDKVKLAGLIAIGLGFLVMTGLFHLLMNALVDLIFPSA